MPTRQARLQRPPARRALKLTTLAALLLPALGSHAVTYTWQGGNPSTVWGLPLNWVGASAPVSAADTVIRFPTLAGISQNNLGNNFQVNQIRAHEFASGGGVVTGQSLRMAGPNAEILVGPGGTLNLATQLTGSNAWRKTGNGTLVLSGANVAMGGNIDVQAGALRAITALALGTGSITLGSGGALVTEAEQVIAGLAGSGAWISSATTTLGSNGDFTFGGPLSGTGSLTKSGTGTQTFTGGSTRTGNTRIEAGTLALAGASAQHNSGASLTVLGGATAVASGGAGWGVNGPLLLGGGAGEANVRVTGGSSAAAVLATLGSNFGESGRVRVEGAGSRFNVAGPLLLGRVGEGVLEMAGGSGSAGATTLAEFGFGRGHLALSDGASFAAGVLLVADAGVASLSLASAATLTSTGGDTLARSAGSAATATLASGARWDHSGSFVLGVAGVGTLQAAGASQLNTGAAVLGALPTATGSALLDQPGTRWVTQGALTVGLAGGGFLDVTNGAAIESGSAQLGSAAGSDGRMNLRNQGSWTVSGDLVVGNVGSGMLSIETGSTVQASSITVGAIGSGQVTVQGFAANSGAVLRGNTLQVGNGKLEVLASGLLQTTGDAVVGSSSLGLGSARVQGTQPDPARMQVGGSLTIGAGGVGDMVVRDNARVTAASLAVGATASTGRLEILGASNLPAAVEVVGLAQIGTSNSGRVDIGNNGLLRSGAGRIGSGDANASGTATLQGTARWLMTGDLEVGANINQSNFNTRGSLNIGDSAIVEAGGVLTVGRTGVVNFSDGVFSVGRVSFNSLGAFNWSGGTFRITGPDGATLGVSTYLPSVLVLTGNKVLEVTRTLDIGTGTVVLDGPQANVQAGQILLQGGQIVGRTLDLSPTQGLVGWGTVASRIQGGSAQTLIGATGGTLAVGNLNDPQGFVHAGQLGVAGGARLIVQSAALAAMRFGQIDDGGTLQSIRGLELTAGGTLRADRGSTAVVGRFTNNGSVQGSGDAEQWLSFNDAVDGSGGFSGNVRFQQGYDPGGSAAVQIGMGSLGLVGSSIIEMDIAAVPASAASLSGHALNDRLDLTGSALLDGTLAVDFAPGFEPEAGQSFVLMTWAGFDGAFGTIEISGLDPLWRGELSYGANELRLTVAVVPEPGTWALFALGLLGIGVVSRRRSRRAQDL